jgi:hypothetical protein
MTIYGQGQYGIVFTHPKLKYVLKIFNDDAYYDFILLAKKHSDNKNFPKFYGSTIDIGNGYQCIRMEKLSPLSFNISYKESLGLEAIVTDNNELIKSIGQNTFIKVKQYWKNKDLSILKSLKLLEPLTKKHSLDLHGGNFMHRGSDIVITDPLSNDGDGWT